MRLYKCDRCGKIVNSLAEISYQNERLIFFWYKQKDICHECYSEFYNWINNVTFKMCKIVYNPKDKTLRVMKEEN
jgi:hypothetical protein